MPVGSRQARRPGRRRSAVTPESIAAAAAEPATTDFPSLLPLRSDPVWSVVGPPTGAVSARPVAPGTADVIPAVEPGRSGLVVPLLGILVAAIAIVAAIFFAARALLSALSSSSQLPGAPGLPWWVTAVAVIVVVALAVSLARSMTRRTAATTSHPAPRGWRRLLDSRVIGSVMALLLLAAAIALWGTTPGSSADIRELPGQVNGLIQQTIAQPEPGYPRIKIKRVGIDLLLVKGDGKTPPVKYEAFTFPRADHLLADTSSPGNTYVYAHARTGMFWNLHDVNIGDTVEVDLGGGKINRYRVSEIHKSVNWKDFEWLQPTADDRLTLQTCNGWRDEDPRYIVVAHRIPDTSTASAR
jgi:LPXTG-site transpeptidase (sortase) family protein